MHLDRPRRPRILHTRSILISIYRYTHGQLTSGNITLRPPLRGPQMATSYDVRQLRGVEIRIKARTCILLDNHRRRL